MNTGLLRHAVATVLTVYGIETLNIFHLIKFIFKLQQCLPFTVLKRLNYAEVVFPYDALVATVLTVYGIETLYGFIGLFYANGCNSAYRLRY